MNFINKNPKIFIVSGKARSGKDLVSDIICNLYKDKKCKKISYAYYLKNYVKDITGWDGREENKPRDFLQTFGIDFIKNKINNRLLVRRMCEDIQIYSYFYDIIIITDARLVEEIETIKNMYNNSLSIRIISDKENNLTSEQKQHITETNLDNYNKFDYTIENIGIYDKLVNDIKNIINEV